MHALGVQLARRCGARPGTNLMASLACARAMRRRGAQGATVTLWCDDGQRDRHTDYDAWLAAEGLECGAEGNAIEVLMQHGRWSEARLQAWGLAGSFG